MLHQIWSKLLKLSHHLNRRNRLFCFVDIFFVTFFIILILLFIGTLISFFLIGFPEDISITENQPEGTDSTDLTENRFSFVSLISGFMDLVKDKLSVFIQLTLLLSVFSIIIDIIEVGKNKIPKKIYFSNMKNLKNLFIIILILIILIFLLIYENLFEFNIFEQLIFVFETTLSNILLRNLPLLLIGFFFFIFLIHCFLDLFDLIIPIELTEDVEITLKDEILERISTIFEKKNGLFSNIVKIILNLIEIILLFSIFLFLIGVFSFKLLLEILDYFIAGLSFFLLFFLISFLLIEFFKINKRFRRCFIVPSKQCKENGSEELIEEKIEISSETNILRIIFEDLVHLLQKKIFIFLAIFFISISIYLIFPIMMERISVEIFSHLDFFSIDSSKNMIETISKIPILFSIIWILYVIITSILGNIEKFIYVIFYRDRKWIKKEELKKAGIRYEQPTTLSERIRIIRKVLDGYAMPIRVKQITQFLVLIILLGLFFGVYKEISGFFSKFINNPVFIAGIGIPIIIWILIIVLDPFRVGEEIKIGEDFGKIIQRGIIFTKLLTTKREHVYIPNTQFLARMITRYTSREDDISIQQDIKRKKYILKFEICLPYDKPTFKELEEEFIQIVKESESELKEYLGKGPDEDSPIFSDDKNKPFVLMKDFKRNYIKYQFSISINDTFRLGRIKHFYLKKIRELFRKKSWELCVPYSLSFQDNK